MPEQPGDALVQRAVAGDADAMAEVWHDNRSWLAAVLLARTPPGADLEDLLQEVAITLVQRLHQLRDPRRLRPWLRTVAVHVAGTRARRGRRLQRLPDPGEIEDRATAQLCHEEQEHQAVRARQVLELARGLPLDFREPLLLQAVQGLTQKRIAELLELPVTTVETRIARGRRALREALDRQQTEAERPQLRRSARP